MVLLLLAFFIASFSGSSNPVFIKHATTEVGPLTFTAFRFLTAAALVFPFWLVQKQIIPKRHFYKLLPFCVNMVFYSIGIQYTSVTMSALLYAFVPVLTAVFGYLFLKEVLLKEHVLGLLIALLGIGFLIHGSIETSDILSFGTPLGNLLILIATFSWVFQPVAWRSLSKVYSSKTILFFSFLITGLLHLFMMPFELQIRPFEISAISSVSVMSLLGSIVIGSLLFYISYEWLIRRTSAFVGSLILYSGVVSSTLYGVVFFGERLTAKLMLGAIFVILGVFLATTYTQLKNRA